MALGKLGRLAFRNWVRVSDINPSVIPVDLPALDYTEKGRLTLPRNHRAGLITSTDTDTDHDINIAVGQCRDSSDAKNILLETTITKQLDATWAGGDDAGGLNSTDFDVETGIEALTWYHVYLIKDTGAITAIVDAGGGDITCTAASHLLTTANRVTISGTRDYDGDYAVTAVSGGTSFNVTATFTDSQTGTYESVDAGFDKSATAANLLSDSGYTYYRRVGSIRTDATAAPNANIAAYTQRGNEFIWQVPLFTIKNNISAAADVTVAGIPTGFNVLMNLDVQCDDANIWVWRAWPKTITTDDLPVIDGDPGSTFCSNAGILSGGQLIIRSDTAATFRHAGESGGDVDDVNILCRGWFDELGDYD